MYDHLQILLVFSTPLDEDYGGNHRRSVNLMLCLGLPKKLHAELGDYFVCPNKALMFAKNVIYIFLSMH